ncbi:MAG: hypothetical protein QXP67_03790 [Desulfurococcaceae archaeon]
MLKLAVVKLTSCSGCVNQLMLALLLNEDIRSQYKVVYFKELGAVDHEEYDVAFVEGSVSTAEQEKELENVRSRSRFLVALGTCAVQGGVQSLRAGENIDAVKSTVYPEPSLVEVYPEPKPVPEVVRVDYVVPGCPVNEEPLHAFLRKYAVGGLPFNFNESVCSECKRAGLECIMVSRGIPCLGPITHASCGALCPSTGRGCYGCTGMRTHDLNPRNLHEFENAVKKLGAPENYVQVLLRAYGSRSYKLVHGGV